MKKIITTVVAIGLSVAMTMTAWAGTWKQDNIGWWYDNGNGTYQNNGWFQDPADSQWYFASNSGYILQNAWMGNYYLGASGAMLTNTITPDGYKVGSDGAWIQDEAGSYVGTYYYYSFLTQYMGIDDYEFVIPYYDYTANVFESNGSYYLEGMQGQGNEPLLLVKKDNTYMAEFKDLNSADNENRMVYAYVSADGYILVSVSEHEKYKMKKYTD